MKGMPPKRPLQVGWTEPENEFYRRAASNSSDIQAVAAAQVSGEQVGLNQIHRFPA